MNIINEIERLNNLREKDAISEEEFLELKNELLTKNKTEDKKIINKELSDEKLWCSFIHLSQLCSFIFPLLGYVVPIVLWQLKKDKSELIDINGRIVTNWIISKFIYYCVSVFLCFFIVGIPLIIGLAVLSIVFPIVGAVKINSGETWRYPLSITFIKLNHEKHEKFEIN